MYWLLGRNLQLISENKIQLLYIIIQNYIKTYLDIWYPTLQQLETLTLRYCKNTYQRSLG